MVDREILKKVRLFVKEVRKNKITVSKVLIYGSRVSGKAHEYSDIDVAIVSPDFGKDRFREGVNLFKIAAKVDARIEPVPISLKAYKEDTWVPLIFEIRKNGIELKAA